VTSIAAGGSGDVVGPASATDAVPVLFDGTTGKLVKNSTPTGTGNPVLATSPVLTTPNLGTPSTLVATNATGTAAGLTAGTASAVAVGGITGLGTGVATALAVNVGSAGAPVVLNGAGGTPSSITLTNATGTAASLTAGTASAVAVGGITGLGTNVATQLALNANGADVDAIGFRGIPQNSQSDSYTLVLADAGKHIYETGASKTITIPANASVAYEIGTAVTFIATNATGCSIAITTDTMTLAGTTTTGTRTLAQNGMATAVKVTSTSWIIGGNGLT
jgi:hypothetical protein